MANVWSDEKKQQVIALGRRGWTLRRIQQATGVRRETASVYLKAAKIPVRPPGAWDQPHPSKPTKPATEVITDSGEPKPATQVITDLDRSEPATPGADDAIPAGPMAVGPQPSRAGRLAADSPPRSYCQCL